MRCGVNFGTIRSRIRWDDTHRGQFLTLYRDCKGNWFVILYLKPTEFPIQGEKLCHTGLGLSFLADYICWILTTILWSWVLVIWNIAASIYRPTMTRLRSVLWLVFVGYMSAYLKSWTIFYIWHMHIMFTNGLRKNNCLVAHKGQYFWRTKISQCTSLTSRLSCSPELAICK
jgi:hypothetical protein